MDTISKVTPNEIVSTFVDNTHGLSVPYGLAFDGSDNLYISNLGNHKFSKVTPGVGRRLDFTLEPGDGSFVLGHRRWQQLAGFKSIHAAMASL